MYRNTWCSVSCWDTGGDEHNRPREGPSEKYLVVLGTWCHYAIFKNKTKKNRTTSPTILKDGDKLLPSCSFHKLVVVVFLFVELSQNTFALISVSWLLILMRSFASQSKRAQHKWALLYLNVVVICIEIKRLLNVCYWQNLIFTGVMVVDLFNLDGINNRTGFIHCAQAEPTPERNTQMLLHVWLFPPQFQCALQNTAQCKTNTLK